MFLLLKCPCSHTCLFFIAVVLTNATLCIPFILQPIVNIILYFYIVFIIGISNDCPAFWGIDVPYWTIPCWIFGAFPVLLEDVMNIFVHLPFWVVRFFPYSEFPAVSSLHERFELFYGFWFVLSKSLLSRRASWMEMVTSCVHVYLSQVFPVLSPCDILIKCIISKCHVYLRKDKNI